MGGSARWLRSLLNIKKQDSSITDQEDETKRDRNKWKWSLWRTSSDGSKKDILSRSERSDSSSAGDSFAAAIATLSRAPPRDFLMIKQEWAAIRIQSAFRGLLARRALRALKAVVRIQAIFRGEQVRKQAAVTLKCMQSLVKAQVRARSQNMKTTFDERGPQSGPLLKHGWCNIPGTIDDVKTKLQLKQEGVVKRERALAYSLSNFHRGKAYATPTRRTENDQNMNNAYLLNKIITDSPYRKKSTRGTDYTVSYSGPSSDTMQCESLSSSSSSSVSPMPVKVKVGRMPSYMHPTQSIKAKQNNCRKSHEDTKSCAAYNPSSFNVNCDLYPPLPVGKPRTKIG